MKYTLLKPWIVNGIEKNKGDVVTLNAASAQTFKALGVITEQKQAQAKKDK